MKMQVPILMLLLAINDVLPMWCNAVSAIFKPTNLSDEDGPLMLSPLIKQGQLQRARTMSRVHGRHLGMNLESYSGYLTARPAPKEAHLFFWFFPALTNPQNAPVILWMNGGPGLTSLSGLFAEIGPYYITEDGKVNRRAITWLSKFSLIFLDAPVGTGFSFPKSSNSYSKRTFQVAVDVHSVLRQFFQLFTAYSHQDFYVTGQSYAANYAIALAHILKKSPAESSSPINFKGIILMSGMFDPVNSIRPAETMYQTGIITQETYKALALASKTIVKLVDAGHYVQASQIIGGVTGTDTGTQPNLFASESRITGSDNILTDVLPPQFATYVPYVNGSRSVRRALHVGVDNLFHKMPQDVLTAFIKSGDCAYSLSPELQLILNADVKVLFVTGNMDYLVTPVGANQAAEALQWKCRQQFLNAAKRIVWRIHAADANSAGYVKCACSFCLALVRNAGHRLPGNQPGPALDLVDRFINNKPF